jgi:hypothetical protein
MSDARRTLLLSGTIRGGHLNSSLLFKSNVNSHKSNSIDRLVKCTLPSTVCIRMYAAHADETLYQPVPGPDSLRQDRNLYLASRKTLIVGLLPPISGAKILTTPTYPDTTATC